MNKTNKLNSITKKLYPQKGKNGTGRHKKRAHRTGGKAGLAVAVGATLPVLAFLILRLAGLAGNNVETGAPVPEASGAGSFCIDISHHNGDRIVWDSLRVMTDRSGRTVRSIGKAVSIRPVRAVYMKASEGESFRDRAFGRNWSEAGNRDLKRGAYHFFSPMKDPLRQAQNFMDAVGVPAHGDLPPVLDVETFPKGCTKEILNQRMEIWLEEVEKRFGKRPVIYAPDSYLRDLISPELTRRYPVWVAHYNVPEPEFPDYRMWQFTDRAVVHGIPGYTDLSLIEIKSNNK